MANPTPVSYSVGTGVLRAGKWWHALAQFAATVQPGQFVQFPSPTLNAYDPVDNYIVDPPVATLPNDTHGLEWGQIADVDPVTQRCYWVQGRPEASLGNIKIHWFDAREDQWHAVANFVASRAGHTYRSTTVIPEHRLVAYAQYSNQVGVIHFWNIDSNSYHGSIPFPPANLGPYTNAWSPVKCIIWHPSMGAQGSMLWVNDVNDQILKFDWASQTWTYLGGGYLAWGNNHIAGHYHPLMRSVICGGSTHDSPRQLAKVAEDGTITFTSPAPCSTIAGGSTRGVFFPHPRRRASINLCANTLRVWSYEWDADVWVDRGPRPGPSGMGISAVFGDAILLAAYGASGTSKTYVYKPDF